MKNITEAEAFFYGFENHFWDLGLDNLKMFMARLGNPQNQCRVIHVAGTNGKGSVSAFIAEILKAAGYKVGRYHSPVVFEKRENITIDGVKISDDEFVEMVTDLKPALLQASGEEKLPTIFEMETALAYNYFAKKHCDFCVIECGLGGETDATNVTEGTVLSVFASVSMDHMSYLGDTLFKIAKCKAGIIKEGVPALTLSQKQDVLNAIKAEAEEKYAKVIVVDRNQLICREVRLGRQCFEYQGCIYELSVNGLYQQENALLALEAAKELVRQGYAISEEAIRDGLKNMRIPGRFEVLQWDSPIIVIDGAHNPDAALRLRENVETLLTGMNIEFVMGVFSDKDYKKVVEITCDLADNIYTVRAEGTRGLAAEELAQCVRAYGYEATPARSVSEALTLAKENAVQLTKANGKQTVILCFGSLSYLKYVKQGVVNNDY